MRGFQERTESNGRFFVIKHNSICEESSKERPGFVPVEVMNPSTKEIVIKFIKRYQTVEAMVTKIEWRDTEDKYDQRYMSWKIYLDANGEKGVLELPFQSRVSSRFMKLAENIDFLRPVEFRAWLDPKTDSTAFFVGQRENEEDEKSVSVPQKYTRQNPGECPEPIQRLGGKWNFDDQMEFLQERMVNVVIPRVAAARAALGEQSNGHHEFNERPADEDPYGDAPPIEDDDIPF
jgi:hypothetical protein